MDCPLILTLAFIYLVIIILIFIKSPLLFLSLLLINVVMGIIVKCSKMTEADNEETLSKLGENTTANSNLGENEKTMLKVEENNENTKVEENEETEDANLYDNTKFAGNDGSIDARYTSRMRYASMQPMLAADIASRRNVYTAKPFYEKELQQSESRVWWEDPAMSGVVFPM